MEIKKNIIIFVLENKNIMEKVKDNEQKEVITPSQYFDFLKGAKQIITTEALKNSYDSFLTLADKYQKLGQVESVSWRTHLSKKRNSLRWVSPPMYIRMPLKTTSPMWQIRLSKSLNFPVI